MFYDTDWTLSENNGHTNTASAAASNVKNVPAGWHLLSSAVETINLTADKTDEAPYPEENIIKFYYAENDPVDINYQAKELKNGDYVDGQGGSVDPTHQTLRVMNQGFSTLTVRPGYKFVGWYHTTADGTQIGEKVDDSYITQTGNQYKMTTPFDIGGVYTQNATYWAVYEQVESVTINYKALVVGASGDPVDPQPLGFEMVREQDVVAPIGTTVQPTGVKAAPKGYHFVGKWVRQSDLSLVEGQTQANPFNTPKQTFSEGGVSYQYYSEETYVAVYQEDADVTITYTIGFEGEGTYSGYGEVQDAKNPLKHGTTITETLAPVTGVANSAKAVVLKSSQFKFLRWEKWVNGEKDESFEQTTETLIPKRGDGTAGALWDTSTYKAIFTLNIVNVMFTVDKDPTQGFDLG